MSFLGGVAEGAQKEIARQQSTIDALIKDASQVIMADRLATRKRKQTRMSELSDKYNVLKNKKLSEFIDLSIHDINYPNAKDWTSWRRTPLSHGYTPLTNISKKNINDFTGRHI